MRIVYSVNVDNILKELEPVSDEIAENLTVENVKSSCRSVADSARCTVRIDEERAIAMARKLPVSGIREPAELMNAGIEFPFLDAEINFYVVLQLFNFGHGYRRQLHRMRGAGAWQTMKQGIMALQTNSAQGVITAESLQSLTHDKVISCFDLFPHDAGQRQSLVKSLEPLIEMIVQVARNSGQQLLEADQPDFVSFVKTHTIDPATGQASACHLVHQLASQFPAFRDFRLWHEQIPVYFLKKAQLAVAELYQRFGEQDQTNFGFYDIKRLTVGSDNVLPCVLRVLGILELPRELGETIESGHPLPAGIREIELRATTIAATETMLDHVHAGCWSKSLDDYLWMLGKESGFRELERHATPDTLFY